MSQFGQYLKAVRQKQGVSQRALAASAEIDHTYLSKIESGAMAAPSEEVLTRMAEELKHNADKLMIRAGKIPSAWKELILSCDVAAIVEVMESSKND